MTLRDIVTKDLGWKIFSVALATAIWLTVQAISADAAKRINPQNGMMTRTFEGVPVLVVSNEAAVREFKVNPRVVQITVSGKPETVGALDPKQIHAIVNLAAGEGLPDLKKRVDVSIPPGITLLSALPAEVHIAPPPQGDK